MSLQEQGGNDQWGMQSLLNEAKAAVLVGTLPRCMGHSAADAHPFCPEKGTLKAAHPSQRPTLQMIRQDTLRVRALSSWQFANGHFHYGTCHKTRQFEKKGGLGMKELYFLFNRLLHHHVDVGKRGATLSSPLRNKDIPLSLVVVSVHLNVWELEKELMLKAAGLWFLDDTGLCTSV